MNTHIEKFRIKISSILHKEIGDRDVVLLDLPNYFNPGDQLIWEGEEHLLKQLGVNIKYRASHYFFNPKMVSEDVCILLQGGGNFGDMYLHHQNFKESIVKQFPNNKIIILSSTVQFYNKNNLQKSADLFSKHPNLTIFARDKKSFHLLKNNFKKNKIYLIPDAAFAISNLKKAQRNSKVKKILFLLRTDEEKGLINKQSLDFIKNLSVSDWKTYNHNTFLGKIHWWGTNVNKVILHLLFLSSHWNKKNDVYGFVKVHTREKQIKTTVNFLSQYNLIITTRLHGHILACILGIPNIVLDNNYGKNKNFYDTWMNKNPFNAYYANSAKDVQMILKKHFPEFLT